ncbi:hypothetical protein FB451DRAFT_1390747 [Mycena latifolia]|nr:hypothetical protein FB451DRAFT_1390747 [Mycena latifolia]
MPHDIVLLVSIPVHGHSPASVHSWAWVVGVGFVHGVLGFVGKIEVAKTILYHLTDPSSVNDEKQT